MKTKEELNALKEEVETLNKKLAELTEEELEQVTGGEEPGVRTTMYCDACEGLMGWIGDYLGQYFDCPYCHAKGTFHGIGY